MKYILALFILLATCRADNVNVNIAWDAVDVPDLSHYVVKYGTSAATMNQTLEVREATSITLALPEQNMHYLTVYTVNTSGLMSEPSKVLVFQVFKAGQGVPPGAPMKPRKVAAVEVSVEKSKNLKDWQVVWMSLQGEPNGAEFYRMGLTVR